jgi:hypothetical protein
MSNVHDDSENLGPLVSLLGLIVVGILLLVGRRRGAGMPVTALVPGLPLRAARVRTHKPDPIDAALLEKHLQELAWQEALIPPTRLCRALRQRGLPLTSEQQMARELRSLGLRSEVRTVSGRTERRWYDLSAFISHD